MIGVVGLSHLGMVWSAAVASKGHHVVAYDPDPRRCRDLETGHLPIVEQGLPELMTSGRSRLRWAQAPDALRECELIICAADVPTTADNRSDLSVIHQLVDTMAAAAPNTTLVILSQVHPGFTRGLEARLRAGQADHPLQVFYQVETLIFGRAVERALRPERFIVGCRNSEAELPKPYAALLEGFGCPILKMSYESAELAKIAINLFLVSSITTTNTLAELCEAIGADWSEITPALRLDRRIGTHAYLTPGLGLSGGNLERDLVTIHALAQAQGTEAGIIGAWLADSRYRRDWVLRQLHALVEASAEEPMLALWGLAYKAGTASIKNAPAMTLLDALETWAVRAYDPVVSLNGAGSSRVIQTDSALEACRGADALAIMTPWPMFAEVEWPRVRALMRGDTVIDPFGAVDAGRCRAAGLRPLRLGHAVPVPAVVDA